MKEGILYLVFGALTTAVNFVSFNLFDAALHHTILSTALAWFVSVLFAYVTNKRYVFAQTDEEQIAKANGPDGGFARSDFDVKQFFSFVRYRLLSGIIEIVIMFIFVDLLFFNKQVIKLLSNVVVVVLNYIFSKLFVFKKET